MADDSQATGTRCRLLALPAELRLYIYDFYFEQRTVGMIYDGKLWITRGTPLDPIEEGGQCEIKHGTALLRTCRTITTEAQSLLVKNTQVRLFASEPNELVATDGGWKSYGNLEQCKILSQVSRVHQLDLHWVFTSPCSAFQQTPELLKGLGWLEDVKHLKISIFVSSPPNGGAYRKHVLKALDCLGKIRCRGSITITQDGDGYEEGTEVPVSDSDDTSDSDNSGGGDHSDEDDGDDEDGGDM
ncbi:hypothetical protein LTR37_017052 [Vermiconidia calcicola]|uniref:Uncharacterized protein n=1 Tax=Vermiconidia calcicola TaxID=1690605 RepID=A0ACC3MNX8_9PEZI|nr:hypothetical protein LTR37_017052 [Vermiconidia calcicola]